MKIRSKLIKAVLASAVLTCAFTQAASAAQVAGVNYKDTVKVAGKELQLNGLGVRSKLFIKLYAAGLYLPTKKTTTEEIMKVDGPRRMQLVIMRDISADDFINAFISGINANVSKEDRTKIVGQLSKFGEVFAMLPGLKKGDVLDLDWIPGSGTHPIYNGKLMGEVLPDITFHNAVLKIWLGDKPADNALKPLLLSGK